VTAHDFAVDLIATPTQVIQVLRRGRGRTPRLRWDELTDDKIAAIPLLQRLRRGLAR
jgi:5-formyltetrahydrofolate cyclo-ligase